MKFNVIGGQMTAQEINEYVQMFQKKYPERVFQEFTFKIDGDFVDVDYVYDSVPFDRIRRITGYLVGNMTRWNDGKRAEEADRVKHAV